ncbi:A/G-specific adenine glycosylase [Thermophagus sp. OGC60D27]|uniref:A/G-specific adenine glycosylase n=1 Tax=Thermophagus sp. OGC60D27 TaxID=3458415 RepID=UPI00403807D9
MTCFASKIREWYQLHGRKLPWRETADPYKIWISEVILQQTQVKQGLNYYQRFICSFPDVRTLAAASERQIMKHWQGLGYYSRARNLHAAAQTIVLKQNGLFPQTYENLLKLRGIGPYTAAAIASIAFGEPKPVVDGNVYRVLSRVFAIALPIDTSEGKKHFEKLAHKLLDVNDPGTHNQALMDLGALICKPTSPRCHECPVSSMCEAAAIGQQAQFPVKSKKISRKKRWLHFLIISEQGYTILQKRTSDDIWKGLYQFPVIETGKKVPILHIQEQVQQIFSDTLKIQKIHHAKHLLTHQELNTLFYKVNWPKNRPLPKTINQTRTVVVNNKEIAEFPLPQILQKNLSILI